MILSPSSRWICLWSSLCSFSSAAKVSLTLTFERQDCSLFQKEHWLHMQIIPPEPPDSAYQRKCNLQEWHRALKMTQIENMCLYLLFLVKLLLKPRFVFKKKNQKLTFKVHVESETCDGHRYQKTVAAERGETAPMSGSGVRRASVFWQNCGCQKIIKRYCWDPREKYFQPRILYWAIEYEGMKKVFFRHVKFPKLLPPTQHFPGSYQNRCSCKRKFTEEAKDRKNLRVWWGPVTGLGVKEAHITSYLSSLKNILMDKVNYMGSNVMMKPIIFYNE